MTTGSVVGGGNLIPYVIILQDAALLRAHCRDSGTARARYRNASNFRLYRLCRVERQTQGLQPSKLFYCVCRNRRHQRVPDGSGATNARRCEDSAILRAGRMLSYGYVFSRNLQRVWVGCPHLSATAENLKGDCVGSRQGLTAIFADSRLLTLLAGHRARSASCQLKTSADCWDCRSRW